MAGQVTTYRMETSRELAEFAESIQKAIRSASTTEIMLFLFVFKDVAWFAVWAARKLASCCCRPPPAESPGEQHEVELFMSVNGDCWHTSRECQGLRSTQRVSRRRRCLLCTNRWSEMLKEYRKKKGE
jgi:hypothetical protein